jgi:predicted alpha/beta-fold hydrolase
VAVRDFREARLSPAIHLHIERHGGHVGYLASHGTRLWPRKWLDGALAHYFRELCAAE